MNTSMLSVCALALCSAAVVSLSARADEATDNIIVEDYTAKANPPAGYVTYRVFLDLGPGEQLLGISAGSTGLMFSTDDPCGLLNDPDSPYSEAASEDFPQPEAASWDSWVTIGTDCCWGLVKTGPTGSEDAVVTGMGFFEPADGGGWFDGNPGTAELGTYLIAQFTLRADASFSFHGEAGFKLGEGGGLASAEFDTGTIIGPPKGYTLCPADLDGSGVVGFGDLLTMLAAWGPCADDCCVIDLDGDGAVGFADLLQLLSAWGDC